MAETPGRTSKSIFKLLLGFCLGAAVVLIAEHGLKPSAGTTATKKIPSSAPTIGKPWGNLEVTSIPFENSEEIFLDRAARLKKPEWVFEAVTPERLTELLQAADLTDLQRRELLATNTWTISASNCVIHPSDAVVQGLSSKARETIYATLSQWQPNYPQCFPFRFASNRFDERFATSGVSAAMVQLVRSLCYTNAGLLSFCDLDVASKKLSKSDFDVLIRVLYAVPTVRLRLRVGPNDDIDGLVKYWAKGGREKRIRPMLESIARLSGGDTIAVAYLLPGSARLRLYSFPDTAREPTEAREDCFFTSLNFFNRYADEKFLDKNNSRQALQTEYTAVNGPPTYGDLITLINANGDAVHIAVYIADDIVFTKNGINNLQPWVMMRMDDMMSYFPSPDPLRILILRKKEFLQTAALNQ